MTREYYIGTRNHVAGVFTGSRSQPPRRLCSPLSVLSTCSWERRRARARAATLLHYLPKRTLLAECTHSFRSDTLSLALTASCNMRVHTGKKRAAHSGPPGGSRYCCCYRCCTFHARTQTHTHTQSMRARSSGRASAATAAAGGEVYRLNLYLTP